jgi:hypothetical protein
MNQSPEIDNNQQSSRFSEVLTLVLVTIVLGFLFIKILFY